MANDKVTKFIEDIKSLTVLELNELVKAIEEEFGVSAAAPVMMAGGGAGGEAAGGADEKSEYTVFLAGVGENKMGVIKAVKEITGLGLKESKEVVDGAPGNIKEGVSKADAEEMKAKLEEAGATIELK